MKALDKETKEMIKLRKSAANALRQMAQALETQSASLVSINHSLLNNRCRSDASPSDIAQETTWEVEFKSGSFAKISIRSVR